MFRPINDQVVIKRDEHEGQIGSIIVPDQAKEPLTRGVVLAVGPGAQQPSKLADELAEALGVIDAQTEAAGDEATRAAIGVLMGVESKLRRKAPDVKVGDHVLFGKYTGNAVTVKDDDGVEQDCIITRDEEIYGVIE